MPRLAIPITLARTNTGRFGQKQGRTNPAAPMLSNRAAAVDGRVRRKLRLETTNRESSNPIIGPLATMALAVGPAWKTRMAIQTRNVCWAVSSTPTPAARSRS